MPTYEEIFEKVQATLVDALGVDEEEVTRDATLQGDLGAESIDFLDIVFRLERNFGIKIPRGELFPENLMADPEWVADGKLTSKGVEELKARLPYADISKFEDDPSVDKIGDLYTVEMLVQYVQSKLAALIGCLRARLLSRASDRDADRSSRGRSASGGRRAGGFRPAARSHGGGRGGP